MHGLDSKHSLILGSSNLSIPLIFPLVIAAETAKVTKMAAIFQCHFIYPGRYIENHKNILVTKSINFRFEYRYYFIEIHLPAKIKPRTDFDILLVWEYLVLNINNWNEIIAYFFRYLVYIMADKGWLLIFFNHEKWWVIYEIEFFYDRFIVLIAILKLPNGLCYALWSFTLLHLFQTTISMKCFLSLSLHRERSWSIEKENVLIVPILIEAA